MCLYIRTIILKSLTNLDDLLTHMRDTDNDALLIIQRMKDSNRWTSPNNYLLEGKVGDYYFSTKWSF